MGNTTLKIGTQADLSGLREYIAAMRAARKATGALQSATGGGGGDHGGIHTGEPPPPPDGPPGGGGPPPAPEKPAGAAAGARAPVAPGRESTIGVPPPAPPPPLAFHPSMMQLAADRAAMPQAMRDGGGPPPPPSDPGGAGLMRRAGSYALGAAGGVAGGVAGRAGGHATRFLNQAAATATGLGLGGGIFGFALSSGQTFLELSRVITHLGARFRDAEVDVSRFGETMGYTIGQTGPMLDRLGSTMNRTDGRTLRDVFQRGTGFARWTGIDPGAALNYVGTAGRLQGRQVDDLDLAKVLAGARGRGMDQGRLEEELQVSLALQRQQFEITGRGSLGDTVDLQNALFQAMDKVGLGEMARGQASQGLIGGLHGTLTQGGPMRTFLMRAMGYGKDPNLSYIEMRKRLEAGIFGEKGKGNLVTIFEELDRRGFGEKGMFRALEGVAGGKLSAVQIEGIVKALSTKAGREAFMADDGGVEVPGWADLGKTKIAVGEHRAVQLEGMKMDVGAVVSEMMLDMGEMFKNLFRGLRNLLGANVGESLTKATETLVKLTEMLADYTEGSRYTAMGLAEGRAGALHNVIMSGQMGGPAGVLNAMWAENLRMMGIDPSFMLLNQGARDAYQYNHAGSDR